MQEKDTRQVKLRTIYGKVLTVIISKQTDTAIYGTDKFGVPVVIPLEDIECMLPFNFEEGEKNE